VKHNPKGVNRPYALMKGIRLRAEVIWGLVLYAAVAATAAQNPDTLSVRDFGAYGDGKTDDTAAFQRVLDMAGQSGGGVVYAPRGNYFFAGHLKVPTG